jgi:nucleoside-diphosphate-sugar epimerase
MIGRHVVREALGSGHDVIAVSRSNAEWSNAGSGRLDRRRADLADKSSLHSSLSDADAIIHCAAYYPGPPKPLAEEMATARKFSVHFFSACAKLPLRKIVFVGARSRSPGEKTASPATVRTTTTVPPPDKNPYNQVKWLQDAMALEQASRGLPVVIGVPSMNFGEFDPAIAPGVSSLKSPTARCRATFPENATSSMRAMRRVD